MHNKQLKIASVRTSDFQTVAALHALPSTPVTIRFPSFPYPFDQAREDVYYYEHNYEAHCSEHPPSVQDLSKGVSNYPGFPSMSPGDANFWEILCNAPDGDVYFVDLHFDNRNLNRLLAVCDKMSKQIDRVGTHIAILTGVKNEFKRLLHCYDEKRSQIKSWGNVDISVYAIKQHDFLHDRFVLLGDHFWHFGASAGGMHAGLNAYSGPWMDTDKRLSKILTTLMRKENYFKRLSVDEMIQGECHE